MAERLVLDASAALAFLRDEPRRADVVAVLEAHLSAGGILIVPEIFWLEITNVQVRRHAMSLHEVLAALRDLDDFGIETVVGDRSLTILGLDLMMAHDLSAYDAAYLALAVAEGVRILTTDARLDAAAGSRSILADSGGLRENRAPCLSSAASGVWAPHGAYLAELRSQVEAGILR